MMSWAGECSEEWVEKCWGDGDPRGSVRNGIGIITGSRSRLLIVDVDTKHQSGDISWEAWRAERANDGQELPDAPLVRTPSGGFHLWFRIPEGLVVKRWIKWLPGVDILGDGGFTCLPPTYIAEKNRSYEFMNDIRQIPKAPAWFLEGLVERKRQGRVGQLASMSNGSGDHGFGTKFDWLWFLTPGAVEAGEQHDALVSAAHSARTRDFSDEEALDCLIKGVRGFTVSDASWPWTDQDAIDKWEEAKLKPAGSSLNTTDLPQYTPRRETEQTVEAEPEPVGRPRLRLIEGGSEDDEGSGGGGGDEPPTSNEPPPPPPPFSLDNTDRTNAFEFAQRFDDQVLWTRRSDWHHFDGTHWVEDVLFVRHVLHRFTDDIDQRAQIASGLGDPGDEVDVLRARVRALKTLTNQKRILEHAQDFAVVDDHRLDANRLLVNFPNGTFDLTTGELREHDRRDLITRMTAVPYVADAQHDLLDLYRQTFFPEDDHWEALWRLLGAGMIGGNDFRMIVFIKGESTSGKGLLFDLLEQRVLGNYFGKAQASVLRGHANERPRTDLVRAVTKRIVAVEEAGADKELHGDHLKELAGAGTLTIRDLYKNEFTRAVEFTLYLICNEDPVIKHADPALRRRIKVVPFLHSVLGREDVRVRNSMMVDEGVHRAILAQLVAGARRAYELGVDQVPAAFQFAATELNDEASGLSSVREFMHCLINWNAICGEETQGKAVRLRELFEVYTAWRGRTERGEEMTVRQFGRSLVELGYRKENINGGMRVLGIRFTHGLAAAKTSVIVGG
jgi:putative DNA primase/helicase